MASDETRRLLKTLGIAVTEYEDAIQNGAPSDQIRKWETQARARLDEVRTLIERLPTAAAHAGQREETD
jgi:hypothetical protein